MSDKDTIEESPKEEVKIFNKRNKFSYKDLKNENLQNQISLVLMDIIYKNTLKPDYNIMFKKQEKSIFTSKFPPKISLGDFIRRIINYTKICKSTLIYALIYLDRICKYKNYILTDYNTHRLFFSAILLAIKYNEDCFNSNKFYSKICGIKLKDLNSMEYNFAIDISFDFHINHIIYKRYEEKLLF